jgi:hypothetical protein
VVRQVHVLWMVRETSHLSWASKELEAYTRRAGGAMQRHLYVTHKSLSSNSDSFRASESGEPLGNNKEAAGFGKPEETARGVSAFAVLENLAEVKNQRPYLPCLLPSLISRRRVVIFGG